MISLVTYLILKMLTYLITSVCIIQVIIILYNFFTLPYNSSNTIYPVIPLRRCLYSKENIKSGDLLFIRTSLGSIGKIFIPFLYKHVAIVVEYDNELYVAETSKAKIRGRHNDKIIYANSSTNLYKLPTYMKNMLGPVYLLKLNKPLSESQVEVLQDLVLDMIGKPYPSPIELYINYIYGIPIKKLQCISFVNLCLVSMGLIKNKKESTYDQGVFITNINKYDLLDGYKYEDPKQLIYDYECNEESF